LYQRGTPTCCLVVVVRGQGSVAEVAQAGVVAGWEQVAVAVGEGRRVGS